MEKMAQALEKALEELLGATNLPSRYPDFQALTRDLVRKLADKVVLVDRKTWNEVSRSVDYDVNSLEKATDRFKAHNDRLEAAMSRRESIPPGFCTAKKGDMSCTLPLGHLRGHVWEYDEDNQPAIQQPSYHNHARR